MRELGLYLAIFLMALGGLTACHVVNRKIHSTVKNPAGVNAPAGASGVPEPEQRPVAEKKPPAELAAPEPECKGGT